MRRIGAVPLLVVAFLLVLSGTGAAHEVPPDAEPLPLPDPAACRQDAFGFASAGFRPASRGSLTRFRIRAVLGSLEDGCGLRRARAAVFDRRVGSRRAFRVSRWARWTAKRRFASTLRTWRYRCGYYRAVYIEIWYEDTVRIFRRQGARGC